MEFIPTNQLILRDLAANYRRFGCESRSNGNDRLTYHVEIVDDQFVISITVLLFDGEPVPDYIPKDAKRSSTPALAIVCYRFTCTVPCEEEYVCPYIIKSITVPLLI